MPLKNGMRVTKITKEEYIHELFYFVLFVVLDLT